LWAIVSPFGGGCYRYVESYNNGELTNRKVYVTGASNPIIDYEKKLKNFQIKKILK